MKIFRHLDGKDKEGKPIFKYTKKDKTPITDKSTIEYLIGLRIPPAWENVEVDYTPDAKQTVKGFDDKGRMQCLYSECHKKKARAAKFVGLIKFGTELPKIEADVNRLLDNQNINKKQIIALILRVIARCSFRLGNLKYEAQNDSYGITTIRKKHVHIKSEKLIVINFIGKKGVENECQVTDKQAINVLKQLYNTKKDDDHMMMYVDPDTRQWAHVTHLDINNFLKSYSPTITSKDFRTFTSNILLINKLREASAEEMKMGTDAKSKKKNANIRKKIVNVAVKEISDIVHNTPAICKKDYIDSDIFQLFIDRPVSYRANFISPGNNSRIIFINWLKKKYKTIIASNEKKDDSKDSD
jgi:DNA topoisomerase-1